MQPTPQAETKVRVRRQWNDWRIGEVRFSDLEGFHWSTFSGGIRKTSRAVIAETMANGSLTAKAFTPRAWIAEAARNSKANGGW